MSSIAPTAENIVKISAVAADEARRLAGWSPMYSSALYLFEEGMRQAEQELIRRITSETPNKNGE